MKSAVQVIVNFTSSTRAAITALDMHVIPVAFRSTWPLPPPPPAHTPSTPSHLMAKLIVYRKTLNALAYPISENTPHNFEVFNSTSPTYSYECEAEWQDNFQAVSNIFVIDPVEGPARVEHLVEVERSIVFGTSQWFAKLAITVKSAQGLIGKDKSGRSDPFATVPQELKHT
ncbi:Protein unc-13 C [Echinococcus granulosus]|uniref:Protein unc-13 C n=1 Tax=Echinococcus granulosus TaxID=6210 RepID=W6UC83_ECHGR|nr:Protein unc-13 C [Echinococcus granulosus]EUB58830.1 Protein unc-13 C [Echinococcus granulosus]